MQTGDDVIFATHLCDFWDPHCSAESAARTLVPLARKNGATVVYLQHAFNKPGNEGRYYCEDLPPSFYVQSKEGEHSVRVPARRAILIGGNFPFCTTETVDSILEAWKADDGEREIVFVTSGLYDKPNAPGEYPESFRLAAREAYKAKYPGEKITTFVTLTVQQALDLLKTDNERMEHLSAWAKKKLALGTDRRIVVEYRGQSNVLVPGEGNNPKSVTLRFLHPTTDESKDLEKYLEATLFSRSP